MRSSQRMLYFSEFKYDEWWCSWINKEFTEFGLIGWQHHRTKSEAFLNFAQIIEVLIHEKALLHSYYFYGKLSALINLPNHQFKCHNSPNNNFTTFANNDTLQRAHRILLDKYRSPFSFIRPINIMASFTAAVEHIRTYSMLNMLTNHIPTPSFTSLLVLLTMGLAAMALYVTCLYVRLSRMKSARPFEEIPTVPSVQWVKACSCSCFRSGRRPWLDWLFSLLSWGEVVAVWRDPWSLPAHRTVALIVAYGGTRVRFLLIHELLRDTI